MRSVRLLDTSVLLHDPAAVFRFGEQDLYLPLAVLHGLDNARHGQSEEARNALQASRFLDQLLSGVSPSEMERGLPLGEGLGRLYFITEPTADADVLAAAQTLTRTHPDIQVTLVARDINLRIQASVLGLQAEDHESEARLDDPDLLPGGVHSVSDPAAPPEQAVANEFLLQANSAAWRLHAEPDTATLVPQPIIDFSAAGEPVWGIHARNQQQTLALNLLMDPDVELVTLLGPAGTGKTLLTLAAGLAQTLETGHYEEILMTRATIAIGEDIGYLPGTEEEKMTPWMGALMDNLEVLSASTGAAGPGNGASSGSRWAQAATQDLLQSRVRVRSLNFMRGRTLLNRYMVLDEAQNLTPQQMRTLITRAGPGTKIVCLGNVAQIDTPWLTPTTSGLTYLVRRFRDWPHSGHLNLTRGERSRLAAHASDVL
ncbi:PhoH-like protein [Spiribacter salinus M19-40]|jgi:PhoH-like ATPase|uniref:PhoH-like protein n=1 Tax=Spiribacter salinus M19-40 TaxID=1260251 RepID=R4VIX0_9GAMM|nr:PhoH family protein [Spiribacter salinus]AGM40532.1 PhoH-like protein [Spiribacter salinus M19-40]MBY5267761.1 phosphate starvation-inducible protein PhoH [Spiribacter salinus]